MATRRRLVDVLLGLAAVMAALMFFFGPSSVAPAAACDPVTGEGCDMGNGGESPPPPPPSHNQTNPCQGYSSCTCVNGVCHGSNGPPPPPPPPAGNFRPPPPPPGRTPPPPPPVGNFMANQPASAQNPTANVSADMPSVGAGAATNGPAVDVNGKAIAVSKSDTGSDTMAFLAFFLMLMGAGGLLILLMMMNRV